MQAWQFQRDLGILGKLFGRKRPSKDSPQEEDKVGIEEVFEDYIVIKNGNVTNIEKAIIDHTELWAEKGTVKHSVKIYDYDKQFYSVEFHPKLPPYEFLNQIGWLDAPPDIQGVNTSFGRMTSVDGGTYIFYPEKDNGWGDTLIGYSEKGTKFRVYLPDIGVTKLTVSVPLLPRQFITKKRLKLKKEFEIFLTQEISTVNAAFEITHPDNHVWH